MFGGRLGIPELLLIMIILLVTNILPTLAWWKIFTKAGHPGIIGFAMAIPVLNLGILLWFAFSKWPIANQAFIQPH